MAAHRRRRRVRRWIGRLLWQMHRWIYRRTGGRVGGRLAGMPVMMLTTRGRRSGMLRTVALTYLPDGQNFVVIASKGGARRHPDWYANLRVRPHGAILAARRVLRVTARDAVGQERERLWARAVAAYRGYASYQMRTLRRIPVVILEPEEPDV